MHKTESFCEFRKFRKLTPYARQGRIDALNSPSCSLGWYIHACNASRTRSPKSIYHFVLRNGIIRVYAPKGGPNMSPSAATFRLLASRSRVFPFPFPNTFSSPLDSPFGFGFGFGFCAACSRRAFCKATKSTRSGSRHLTSFFLKTLIALVLSGCLPWLAWSPSFQKRPVVYSHRSNRWTSSPEALSPAWLYSSLSPPISCPSSLRPGRQMLLASCGAPIPRRL